MIGPPHFGQKLALRKHSSGILQQRLQQAIFVRRQMEIGSIARHRAFAQVDFDRSEPDCRPVIRNGGRPAQRRTQAGHQFTHGKRFRNVVIGAQVERGNLVALLATRGENDDGHLAEHTHGLDNFESVLIGEAEIKQDDVGLASRGVARAFGGSRGLEVTVILGRKSGSQEAADLRVVFDNQDKGLHATGCSMVTAGSEKRKTARPKDDSRLRWCRRGLG